MTKINCIIITKAKGIVIKKVSDSKDFFVWRKGIYNLDRTSVGLTKRPGFGLNPSPELIFIEGEPMPINSEVDPTLLLERIVIDNALKQVSDVRFPFLNWIMDILEFIKENPFTMIWFIIIFVVLYAVVVSFI